VRQGQQARARRQRFREAIHVHRAIRQRVDPFQHRALALAQEVPRHDVGVMLHDREHDLVTGLDAGADPRCDDVDRLGAALGEDDLFD
jgi:hypothetical protein